MKKIMIMLIRVFFIEVLEKRGFKNRWIGWIKKILTRASVGVTINNVKGEFFQIAKGLRQGDPLSTVLFNLVVDILSRMLQKAAENGLIKGLGNDIIEGGVISLPCSMLMTLSCLWIRTWSMLKILNGF
jgi:hypothetical protein